MKNRFRILLPLASFAAALTSLPATAAGKEELVEIDTTLGNIVVRLAPDRAPITVKNFLTYVREGFYKDTIFHRVIPGFMIQGGCPDGNGMGGPGYSIEGEFAMNGFNNDLKHERGVLSMARSMNPNSAGSQFFIMVDAAPHLDGQYAAFGKIIEGMDAADKIVAQPTNAMDKPDEPQVMKKVTIVEE